MKVNTRHWVDLYTMILDRLAEQLADPAKTYRRLGILEEYKKTQKSVDNPPAAPAMPSKLQLDEYKVGQESWKRVKADILQFGLECSEDLSIAPSLETMDTPFWRKNPYLEIYQPNDETPLVFRGRDALTAFGFFNFFIQHVRDQDPRKYVKDTLSAQGITAENFRERMPLSDIANPFLNEENNKEPS